jgi:hypothetical protein
VSQPAGDRGVLVELEGEIGIELSNAPAGARTKEKGPGGPGPLFLFGSDFFLMQQSKRLHMPEQHLSVQGLD